MINNKAYDYDILISDFDEKYFRQLWLGNYTEREDIEKRPLAKFMQDLWEQANGVIRR